MASTAMVHVRVEGRLKERATKALEAMGLSVSDAVRVFLARVAAEQQIPFDLRVPNTATRRAMAEAEEIVKARRARFRTARDLFRDLEKTRK